MVEMNNVPTAVSFYELPTEFRWESGKDPYYGPSPLPGEIARIVTGENSDLRCSSGAPTYHKRGFVLVRTTDEGVTLGVFEWESRRRAGNGYDRQQNSSSIEWSGEYDYVPVFLWRTVDTAYHHEFRTATADVEVRQFITSTELADELRPLVGEVSQELLDEFLRHYSAVFEAASAEEMELCPSLYGMEAWLQRSRMDIRSLALRWLIFKEGALSTLDWTKIALDAGKPHPSHPAKFIRVDLEEFADPRPPSVWKDPNGRMITILRGREVMITSSGKK